MASADRRNESFMFDRAAETMARDELEALQLDRLKQTVARAYARVPHVREKLDAAGVRPDQLTSLADLARFPFTVKADLRDNYPFGLFAVPREEVTRLQTSIQLEQMLLGRADDKLDQLVDAYKVSWTLLRPRSAAALHFDRSPRWRRIYADRVAVVHVRN